MVYHGNYKAQTVIIMKSLAFLLKFCSPCYCFCHSLLEFLRRRFILVIRARLLLALAIGIQRYFSPGLPWHGILVCFLPCYLCLPETTICSAIILPCCRAMIRHRMRSHQGRSHGGCRRSQAAQVDDQLTPPAFQAMTAPSSPSRRPLPYHAFQNYHFRFQSSLLRPIISANISIIILEEESQPPASAHTRADSSQGGLRFMDCQGVEPQRDENEQACTQNERQATDMAMGGALSPGSSPHGALASIVVQANSGNILQDSIPPGGNGEDAAVKHDDFWYGNTCPVVEEPLNQDKVM